METCLSQQAEQIPSNNKTIPTNDKKVLVRLNRLVDKVNPAIDVELWKIRFRISNHEPSDKSFSKSNERRFIFRCITLGNNEIFESSFQSLRVIAKTLDRLEAGNLEAVMQMNFHDNSTDFEWERGV